MYLVQQGSPPRDFKPLHSVGGGVMEIRVQTGGAYRVIYVARFSAGVHVLHAFIKKSQKTAARDLELARRRYHELASEGTRL